MKSKFVNYKVKILSF